MIYYHVRTTTGITLDWTDSRENAFHLANREGAHVYLVNAITGHASRIK